MQTTFRGFHLLLKLTTVLILLGLFRVLLADMYSSMLSIQQALTTERVLLQHLKTYIEQESHRLNDLRRFYEKVDAFHHGADTPIADPIHAYTLLKRLQLEWMNVVHSLEASENIQALQNGYEQVSKYLPITEDVEGAAKALMRLQDVYSLNVKGLAKGMFQRDISSDLRFLYSPEQLSAMSADDCFHIGKTAYDMEDYYHSIPWLEEAVSLFRASHGNWFTEDEGSLQDALDYLAFSYYKTGNISHALDLSRECLLYDPDNGRVAQNVAKYERILEEKSESSEVEEAKVQRPNVTHLRTRDLYEGLCQNLGSQPMLYKDPRMLCSYVTNNHPRLILQPVKRELVSLYPYVVLYHDFVSDREAEIIKGIASPWLQRSVVASGEKQSEVEYRISKSAWLKDTAHPVIRKMDNRIAAITGLNILPPYAEYLQVVNYGIGGHYEPHFDHATSRKSPLYRTNTGNRLATFMIYLSSVDAGGSTAFIYANFSTPVVKNAALFWWNLHRNGKGNEDTLHAGCPVLIGNKWVANKWIHEHGQEFNRPCSVNPAD
ncbi:prolyl 4-hydroxylase subunit alpha-3 [Bombina bombina]|uniref:prolyl 4-hydroxylase subunit alpha-3 n=1 Tax=Bombina bombina TaxID=8345 RepID=UPI00235B23A3|nr:prolyl 4-hydroxylase subunit alpha-3 [Bombina bombina]